MTRIHAATTSLSGSSCYDAAVLRSPRTAARRPSGQMSASIDQRLQSLLEEYTLLLRYAIRSTLPRTSAADVDDVLQDARLRLWKVLRKRTTIHNPRSFVYRVAVTAALDAMRRISRRREEPLETDGTAGSASPLNRELTSEPRVEERAAQRQTLRAVRRCLDELSDDRRRAVALHVRGFKPDEVGRMLGWTESKARNLVYRGLRELRAALEREGVHYDAT